VTRLWGRIIILSSISIIFEVVVAFLSSLSFRPYLFPFPFLFICAISTFLYSYLFLCLQVLSTYIRNQSTCVSYILLLQYIIIFCKFYIFIYVFILLYLFAFCIIVSYSTFSSLNSILFTYFHRIVLTGFCPEHNKTLCLSRPR